MTEKRMSILLFASVGGFDCIYDLFTSHRAGGNIF